MSITFATFKISKSLNANAKMEKENLYLVMTDLEACSQMGKIPQ
jgi:hypothetical protein